MAEQRVIRDLMEQAHSCPAWQRDALNQKLINALRDPRWYLAGWNRRAGLPHLKRRVA